MKTMKIWKIAFALLSALFLVSCSKDIDKDNDKPLTGLWPPMVWVTEAGRESGGAIAPAAGGELTYFCRNYPEPWICAAKLNGKNYYPNIEANDYWTITVDWFKAEINGNKLTVVIKANDTGEEREILLAVTAGDIFDYFLFKQPAN